MLVRIFFAVVLCSVAVPSRVHAANAKGRVSCENDGRVRKVSQIKRRARSLNAAAKRFGLHVLDLGPDGAAALTALDAAQRRGDWCAVANRTDELDVLLRGLDASDAEFLRSKTDRVDAWVRGSIANRRKLARAERLVERARSDVRQGRLKVGNTKLNQVLAILTGSRDLMTMPPQPLVEGAPRPESDEPVPDSPRRKPVGGVLSKSLALESCPELDQGEPGNGELASILERLRDGMAAKKFRAVDFKYGPELFEILVEEGRGGSRGRAATAACVLLTRIAENPRIGMGIVMGRFSRVNALRDTRGVPEQSESRFTELVRQASEQIQLRQLDEAYSTLDELLVLLGDPIDQSKDVP